MKFLAFYTCFYGGRNNYSFMIPPLPSKDYDCYFFTNNSETFQNLGHTGWIRVFMPEVPIHDNHYFDTMETKLIRTCQHKYAQLDGYEYICWMDSKLHVFEDKVLAAIEKMKSESKCICLVRHPNFETFLSVWDEYNLAMICPKYAIDKEKAKNYIETQLKLGFSEKQIDHSIGGCQIRKVCNKTNLFGETWYKHIQECGIEDQISLQFIRKIFKDDILYLGVNETWKYMWD